jgi:hypothetical protein
VPLRANNTGIGNQDSASRGARSTDGELSICFSGINKVEAESVSPPHALGSRYFGRRACVLTNVQYH